MGSSTIIENNIQNTMSQEKKSSIKCKLFNILGIKKGKEDDRKEKKEHKPKEVKQEKEEVKVETLVENFRRLQVQRKKQIEENQKKEIEKKVEEETEEEDDEFRNFSFKNVDKDRTQSNSSHDSGFDEKSVEKLENDVIKTEDDVSSAEDEKEQKKDHGNKTEPLTKAEEQVLESFGDLKIEDGKKKKCQVVVSRGPNRNRAGDLSGTYHPYRIDTQIKHTVNKHTFSGGQVIVANRIQEFPHIQNTYNDHIHDTQTFDDDLAAIGVEFNGQPFDLEIVQEFLDDNASVENDILKEFLNDPNCNEHLNTIANLVDKHIEEQQNPIEELENTQHLNYEKIENLDTLLGLQEEKDIYSNIFPTPPSTETAYSPSNNEFYGNFLTPPRSETIPSPMSDSTLYPSSSDFVLSPNSDCEKYQEITSYEEYPSITQNIPSALEESIDKKARERNTSTSSLSLKNFKDLQKELAATFSKMECCQMNRKPCREIFQGYLQKLKVEERKNMCLKVASMDLKSVYGVLHHIMLGLSRGDVDEDFHFALFAVLCEKVLGTKPELFLEDFGLSLLKAAALRCNHRPLLVRYLVCCIRAAAKHSPQLLEGKDYLFKELDGLGDTLVGACARAGDSHAAALAELVRAEPRDKPLFNLDHTNTDGYTALHVACREHSAATPHLHTTHVLLEHAGADIWKGDVKGGDTAAHMAVNSAHCDLRLVLLLFRHLDRKEWKRLAHKHNRSSMTPLDNARSASKSTTRTNYPTEVLEFLKKCR